MKKTKSVKKIEIGWVCLFGLGLFFLLGGKAAAFEKERYEDQVEDRFLVSPSRLELRLEPGQKITDTFEVVNRLGRKQDFQVMVENLVEDESGSPANSAKDWVVPEIAEFSLEHGERIKMNFSINVPEKIPSGGYYASLLVVADNQSGEASNLKLISRVGVSLLASIPGEIEEKGEVIFFRPQRKFYFRGPVELFSLFENQSNIHLSPTGEISIFNFLGGKVAQMPLAEATVLPGAGKEWKTVWQRKWLLGRYPAVLKIHYGQEGKTIVQSCVFWAFPVDILLLLIGLLYLAHRLLKKWQANFEIKRKNNLPAKKSEKQSEKKA